MLDGLFDIVAGHSAIEFIAARFKNRPGRFLGWIGWLVSVLVVLVFLAMLAFGLA